MNTYKSLWFCILFHLFSAVYAKQNIHIYINQSWKILTRSVSICDAYNDNKVNSGGILYLPKNFLITSEIRDIQKRCHIQIKFLSKKITRIGDVKTTEIHPHGLLYLPHPYVVPGGRFNEMYGWDSYFILLGLLRAHEIILAKQILENYFFEVNHYGGILNANRTYHLSRSQSPFLTASILALWKNDKTLTRAWLERAYFYAKKEYAQWIQPPFLANNTQLARYYDNENEKLIESNVYPHYYQNVHAFIKKNSALTHGYVDQSNLSKDFYQGERSLRASGFDITHRFGPFGGRTHHYAAVCLNSLLFKTENDLATIARLLGKNKEAAQWMKSAAQRQRAMFHYMYNKRAGLFFDYDFIERKQSTYHYVTTLYPLWAGVATKKQARSIVEHLNLFERSGGLMMSDVETGLQWDKPFGWAPIQIIAVQGLLRYGYKKEAERIARKFKKTIESNFNKTGFIYEKYNVMTHASNTPFIGYKENVIGFGWTNSAYLLFDDF